MRLVYWPLTMLVTAALVLFVVANRQTVQFEFMPFTEPVAAPLWTIVAVALLVAFLIGNLVGWLNAGRWRRETRLLRRRVQTLEHDLAAKEAALSPAHAGPVGPPPPPLIAARAHP